MRLPRMTTRRWMVMVVAVGAAFWAYRVRERLQACNEAIDFHTELEQMALSEAASPSVMSIQCGTTWNSMTKEERLRFLEFCRNDPEYRSSRLREAAYHARAKQKLTRAAWRLWEALPDDPLDPPEPEHRLQ